LRGFSAKGELLLNVTDIQQYLFASEV